MIKLTYKTDLPEYSEIVQEFISNKNPIFHAHDESRVEAIMKILIGSRNIRLGPQPTIESQFHMREVVRRSINRDQKIPILIPSGPKKTVSGYGIDVAELSMLNIINCVNQGIKQHYKLGIEVLIRLEDLTGMIMEPDYMDDMSSYIQNFKDLIKVLGYNFIIPWKESESNKTQEFLSSVNEYVPEFEQYILDSWGLEDHHTMVKLPSFKYLLRNHWVGVIPMDQRQMYMDKYNKLYPELSEDQCINLMGRYFASSLARKNLGITGIQKHWDIGNLDIAFMPPVPNYTHPTRLYYRSIELKNSKKSLPFWRAKGFLKLHENGKIRISSATFKEAEQMPLNEGTLIFKRNDYEAHVRADILLVD